MSPDQMADALSHIDGMRVVADYLEDQGLVHLPARLRQIAEKHKDTWIERRDHFPSLDDRGYWQRQFRDRVPKQFSQWQLDAYRDTAPAYTLSWLAAFEWNDYLQTLVCEPTADERL